MTMNNRKSKTAQSLELTEAMTAGIEAIAQNMGEGIEARLIDILKAALKAGGGGSENRAGVEAMTRAQVTQLMNAAANVVITAVEDNFSGVNPVEDWGGTCQL